MAMQPTLSFPISRRFKSPGTPGSLIMDAGRGGGIKDKCHRLWAHPICIPDNELLLGPC